MANGKEHEASTTRVALTPESRETAEPQSRRRDEEPDRVGGDLEARETETPAAGRVKPPPADATRGG